MPGTLNHSPARIIRDMIVDLGLGSEPSANTAWPVYADIEPDSPDPLIAVFDTAAVLQGRVQVSGQVQEFFGISILVRSANPSAGWTKANSVGIALDGLNAYQRSVSISANVYEVHSLNRRSGVISAGKGPNDKRNLYTLNYITSIRQTT